MCGDGTGGGGGLTSLNLSHDLPVSHLSSKKLPLSARAETRPKATAHTHSRATLSICGHARTRARTRQQQQQERRGTHWVSLKRRTPH